MWTRAPLPGLAALAILSFPAGAAARPAEADPPTEVQTRPLAATPLCEASAALIAPWDEDEELVLVADNELDRQLFTFSIDGDRLVPGLTLAMPRGRRPRDLEALAPVGESLLVVGSHSRNSRCEKRPNRQRLRLLERRSDGSLKDRRLIDGAETWARAMSGEADCLESLFVGPAPELAVAACRAFLDAEEEARAGSSCPVLNIEGAFGTRGERVWLGLRAPLVEGAAVLLRLASDLDAFRFDRVALLRLAGRGVRELAVADDTLYILAGPAEDAGAPFALFAADLGVVVAGGRIAPRLVRSDLPTSSEGLFIAAGHAVIVIDGVEGEEANCARPSRQYRVELDRGPA